MRFRTLIISLLTAALLCMGGAFALAAGADTALAGDVTPEQMVKMTSVQVPFVPNEGQINDERVKYYAKTFAGTVFVTNEGIIYDLPKGEEGGWVLKEEFAGARALVPAAASPPGAQVNYYLGSLEKHLSSYQEITLGEVYDKVNVNLRAYGNNVEKIFTVAPGGDPADIALKVSGADKLSVNAQGELELATGLGTVKMTRPVACQDINGQRVNVDVAYVVKGDTYGFAVGDYDRTCPLVIDPLLASTYLGGSKGDYLRAIAIDAAGNVFVAGYTNSDTFFTVTGGYRTTLNGTANDAFVAKLSGNLKQLLAATYLGGSAAEQGNAIALDNSGHVYVAGYSASNDFYTTVTPHGSGSDNDFFVVKLDDTHLNLIASTCYGGANKPDNAYAIALDPDGNVFVWGSTQSTDLSVTGYQKSITSGSNHGLLLKYSADLSQILASTYLGGSTYGETLYNNTAAVDQSGDVYVGGTTNSNSFPTTDNAFIKSKTKDQTSYTSGFVSKLSNDLAELKASTYLGGNTGSTTLKALALDSDGNVCVTGETKEDDFPVTTGAAHTGGSANNNNYVAKLKPDLTGLVASTLVGRSGNQTAYDIACDAGGYVYVTGNTSSTTYPTTDGAYQPALNGTSSDAFVTKLNPDLSEVNGKPLASTYLGGTGGDYGYAMALNAAGNVYIAGASNSGDFPPNPPNGCQGTIGGGYDGMIARLTGDLALNPAPDTTAPIWPAGSLTVSEATYHELTLNWFGAMDNLDVTGYKIYQSDDTGGSTSYDVSDGAAASYHVTGLTDGATYTFKIEATDAAGNWSTDGPSATVTTAVYPDITAPTWPPGSSLTASNITDTGLTLTWTAAVDDRAVTDYKIFQGTDEIATVSSAVYTTLNGTVYYTYNVSNLTVNRHYTFKVEAGDAAGNWSSNGPVTEADTVDIIPPYWVPYNNTGLTCSIVSSTSVLIKWNAASDNVGVTGYRLALEAGGTVVKTVYVDGNTFSYLFTGLDNQTNYHPVVDACDAAGNWTHNTPTNSFVIGTGGLYPTGAYLTTISGNPAASIPGAPVEGSSNVPLKPMLELTFTNNVIADTGKDGVTATWSNNKNCFTLQTAAGADVPVHVLRIPDTINSGAEKNNIFITPVNELVPNTQYKLVINKDLTAKNGTSMVLDQEVHFTTGSFTVGAPAWPDGASLTAPVVADTFVKLSWPAASSSAGIAGYIVFQNGDIVTATDGPATILTVTGLAKSTAYTFKVWAFDAAGNWTITGPELTLTTAATAPAGIPGWSAGQVATVSYTTGTHDSLILSWPAATDDYGIQSYRISQNGTELATVSGTTLSYTVTGLTEATTYNFKIEALNLAGNWSATYLSVNAYSGGGTWTGGGGQGTAPFMLLNTCQTTATPGSATSDTGDAVAGSSSVPVNATFKLNFSKNVIFNWSTTNQDCFTMQDGSGASVPVNAFIINNDAEKNNVFIAPVSPLNPGSVYKIIISANLKANSGASLGSNVAVCFTTAGGADTIAPTWAGSSTLAASGVTQTGLTLTWGGASDNFAVTGYRVYIYQDNDMTSPLTSIDVAGTTCDVSGLTAGTAYTFKVVAGDAAGNWSTSGPVKTVLTATNDTAKSIQVTFSADVTNPAVSVRAFVNTAGAVTTGTLPGLNITTSTTLNSTPVQLQVTIPAGVTVTAGASDWDGTIHAPTVQASSSVTLTGARMDAVIEIGYGDTPLTFSQPVRILIPGQAGKSAGYVRNGVFTKINRISEDSAAALGANSDGYVSVGSDLVVWTKHFTQFVIYTPTGSGGTGSSGGGGGSGGGSSSSEVPAWPAGATLSGSKSQGTVTLSWPAASGNVTSYEIYKDGTSADKFLATVDGDTLTYSFEEGQGTGSHTYYVYAVNAAGKSASYLSVTPGGSNRPYVTEYGVYSYDPDSNTVAPTPIGEVLTTNNTGTSFSPQPWPKLTGVPTTFSGNTAIGIKFATNVAVDTRFSSNQAVFQLLDASDNSVSIRVDRSGDGTSSDVNRNYLFVIPQTTLKSGSSYKIIIGPDLTSNNGMSAGVQQEIDFTTAGSSETTSSNGSVTTSGPTITTGSASVDPVVGATVGLGSHAAVVIPAGALKGTAKVAVSVEKVDSAPAVPADARSISDVYEFKVGNSTTYTFGTNIAVILSFDPSALGSGETPAIFYYDEAKGQWVNLGGTVSGNTITVQVDHFTKFAVLAVKKTATPVIQPGTLTDIAGHWAEADIRKLVELGAVSGYPDGTFKPDNTITRAEFATVLVKAFKFEKNGGKVFADTSSHWARDYIAAAAASGVVNGYDANTFGPDDLITREQMAVMIVKAAGLEQLDEETEFADGAGISGWAKAAVAAAVKNGIMKGYPDGTFRPQGNATRAEAATVLMNALRLPR